MRHCDLTLPSPEENLAADEALLDVCEAGQAGEVLRFWESPQYFVAVGYANQAATEVNLPFCRKHGIPVRRRCTGGGTVLQGPGCLNYALILRIGEASPLQSVHATNEFILQRHQEALATLLLAPVQRQGHTDLAVGGLKFSGNAQRRRKNSLLFHGSFMLHLDVELIEKVLPFPSQQPDYRANRSHTDFLLNLEVPVADLKAALLEAWKAHDPFREIPFARIDSLARERYGRDEWNFKL